MVPSSSTAGLREPGLQHGDLGLLGRDDVMSELTQLRVLAVLQPILAMAIAP